MKTNNILIKTPVKVLLELRNIKNKGKNGVAMAKKVGCIYMTYLKIRKRFEKVGLLTIEKNGRENIVSLTKKGKKVADNLILLNKILK